MRAPLLGYGLSRWVPAPPAIFEIPLGVLIALVPGPAVGTLLARNGGFGRGVRVGTALTGTALTGTALLVGLRLPARARGAGGAEVVRAGRAGWVSAGEPW
ncbi:hypothetical protein [Streptomyces virginiae]